MNIEKMNMIKERLKKEYGSVPVFFIKFTKVKEYAQDSTGISCAGMHHSTDGCKTFW